MRKSFLMLAVPTLVLILAVAAVAVVPGVLNRLSPGPLATSVAAPGWKVGDQWTYNVSLASMGEGPLLPSEMTTPMPVSNESFVIGTLTETVAGSVSTSDGAAWNVTLDGALRFQEPRGVILSQPTLQPLAMPAVSTVGFVWLRQSDLAPIYAFKGVHLSRSWNVSFGSFGGYGMLANATYTLTYDATTQVWYHPPLTVWQFPLQENTTWNVTSNATIRYDASFHVSGPNVTFQTNRSATFTVPIRFAMHTGFFEDVTTPAGTFHALPASATRASIAATPDPDANAVMSLSATPNLEMPHAFATAWFSDTAGNVVRAVFGAGPFGGPRIEMDLTSYTFT